MGEVHGLTGINHVSKRVKFQNKYRNPVVIAEPLSYNGPDQAVLRITNVDSDGFDYFVQEVESKDGVHMLENIGYVVLECGTWITPDHSAYIEVGKAVTSTTLTSTPQTEDAWTDITFSSSTFFQSVPVVFTQVQSSNDPHWVKTRQRHITTSGFRVTLEEEDSNEVTHGGEIVGWIAISLHSNTTLTRGVWEDKLWEVGTTGDRVKDVWFDVRFTQSFKDVPILIAGMQTTDNTDSTHLRYKGLDNTGFQIAWFHDSGTPSTGSVNTESVGYAAFSSDGELSALSADCQNDANDKLVSVKGGQLIIIYLLDTDHVNTKTVKIVKIPSYGTVYQYTGKSLEDEDAIVDTYTVVSDTMGRVVYRADVTVTNRVDMFSYQYESKEGSSNIGTIHIQQIPTDRITPPLPYNPPPRPALPPTTPDSSQSSVASQLYKMNQTLLGLLTFTLIIVTLLALAIVAFGFFLYKKKTARQEMISMFLGNNTSNNIEEGEQIYYPENQQPQQQQQDEESGMDSI
eukprot:TRINITY_DN17950_c0_g1_i1.p1 TRINITY_DN17950_c0_g1~~TRINITY_DN17950_c0_g1_i1.p1  ORF type:complete len:530 (+),score=126.71 TRINITY_DN17950_c0_g1_i1:49-1590(+)